MDISCPVTIIECPPLKIASVRFYKNTQYGLKLISEIFSEKLNKELSRKILLPKKINKKFEDMKDFDDIRVLVYTQPALTSLGKKKPEIFEMGIGGKKEEKILYVQSLLGKEILIGDVLKAGQQVDIHAITRGKGIQGPIKRFGIGLKHHKSEKGVRRLGTLGGWKSQGHFMYRVAHAGQMGYHQRVELNKLLLKIDDKAEAINPKGGFTHYGLVKNSYILVKGSVFGPSKRLIRFTVSHRPNIGLPKEPPLIQYIDTKK